MMRQQTLDDTEIASSTGSEASMKHRARLYTWLSAAFYSPEPEMADPGFAQEAMQLQHRLFPDVSGDFLIALENANRNAEKKHSNGPSVKNTPGEKPISQDRYLELKKEHARLFIGPPKALIYPYESCFFGEDRLMGNRSLKVSSFYERHGVAFHEHAHFEPPDHIAVELEFLSMVCNGELTDPGMKQNETEQTSGRDSDLIKDRHPVEENFLREHLACWGFLFTHDIKKFTEEPLYLAASLLLEGIIKPYADGTIGLN